jgi:hypothetical protein
MKLFARIAAALVAVGFLPPPCPWPQEKLTVWWAKGFYKSEDDALFRPSRSTRPRPASRSSFRNTRPRK